jgi:hypothetical protein
MHYWIARLTAQPSHGSYCLGFANIPSANRSDHWPIPLIEIRSNDNIGDASLVRHRNKDEALGRARALSSAPYSVILTSARSVTMAAEGRKFDSW